MTTLLADFELDHAPGFVRFFFVTSDVRVRTGEIVEVARRLAATPEAAQRVRLDVGSAEQTSLLFRIAPP